MSDLPFPINENQVDSISDLRDQAIKRIEDLGYTVETNFGGEVEYIENSNGEMIGGDNIHFVAAEIENDVILLEEIQNKTSIQDLEFLPSDFESNQMSITYFNQMKEEVIEELTEQINETGHSADFSPDFWGVSVKNKETEESNFYAIGEDKLPDSIEEAVHTIHNLEYNQYHFPNRTTEPTISNDLTNDLPSF